MDRDKIIEKVKLNKRYINNGDLLDSIVDLVVVRLEDVVDSVKDENLLNILIEKTINKSVIDTLKKNNRFSSLKVVNKFQKVDYSIFKYDNLKHHKPSYPISQLKQVYSSLKRADENNESNFLKFLNLRYRECMNVSEIAKELGISTNEVTKTLFDMAEYSNKVF